MFLFCFSIYCNYLSQPISPFRASTMFQSYLCTLQNLKTLPSIQHRYSERLLSLSQVHWNKKARTNSRGVYFKHYDPTSQSSHDPFLLCELELKLKGNREDKLQNHFTDKSVILGDICSWWWVGVQRWGKPQNWSQVANSDSANQHNKHWGENRSGLRIEV